MSLRLQALFVALGLCSSACSIDWQASKDPPGGDTMFDAAVTAGDASLDSGLQTRADAGPDSGRRRDPDAAVDAATDAGGDGGPHGAARLVITPNPVVFGAVTVGASSAKLDLEVKNEGDQVSDEVSATLSGADAERFTLDAADCGKRELAPAEHCTLVLTFAPLQARAHAATLTVEGATPIEVALSGTGLTPGALVSMPEAGEFGSVPLQGESNYRDLTFEIQNSGGSTSGKPVAAITGEPSGFSIIDDNCSMALTPNAKCSVTVRFAPILRGGALSTLLLQAEPGGMLPISLTGVGLLPPSLQITPASVSLSTIVDVGATGTETETLRVTNQGDLVAIPAITLSGATDFDVTNGCADSSLAGGESCTLNVKLKPSTSGAKQLDVSVTNGVSGASTSRITGTARSAVGLSVSVTGGGQGSVSAAPGVQGNGITCGTDCSESYWRTISDPVVRLSASYDAATTNVTWGAPCAGSGATCDVTLSASNTAVQVSFTKKQVTVSVTVSSVGGATGAISGGGIACPGTCSVSVDAGSKLTLTATPSAGFYFQGFSGAGCASGSLTCTTNYLTSASSITATFTKANLIFATSTKYSVAQLAAAGNGNPVNGADALCQARAGASSLGEVRARSFRSLISTQTGSKGIDRITAARGWLRPDALPVGDLPASFLAPTPASFSPGTTVYYPPALDEFGTRVVTSDGTNAALGNGCMQWTSGAQADYREGGIPTSGGYGWSSAYGSPCHYDFRLYCASTDYNAIVTPPPRTAGAKIAFVTKAGFSPGGSQGLSAADALCQSEASAASFTGTFKAFLASTNPATTAVARFASSGPWVRPDGVSVGSYADLNTNTLALLATIQVTPLGEYVGNRNVWSGAAHPKDPSTGPLTCTPTGGLSWTASSEVSGRIGLLHFTNNQMLHNYDDTPCNQSLPVICLQQ